MSLLKPMVDALDIGLKHPLDSWIQVSLGFGRSTIDPKRSQKLICFESFFTKDFTQPTCTNSTVHFHLPETVLSMYISQRKKGVWIRGGKNVWNT